jgi:hypothetical protein
VGAPGLGACQLVAQVLVLGVEALHLLGQGDQLPVDVARMEPAEDSSHFAGHCHGTDPPEVVDALADTRSARADGRTSNPSIGGAAGGLNVGPEPGGHPVGSGRR